MNMHPWYVLHVIANHEKRVAQYLSGRSIEYYLPLYKERARWSDRTVINERPLFTGYVFVRFPQQNRISVISTPGVLRVLGYGIQDMVSDEELDRIRVGLDSGMVLRPHPDVTMGTRVRVRDGVFGGIEGMVTELRHRCHVIIALSAANQCFSLEVDQNELEILHMPVLNQSQKAYHVCHA
jgi:transcription antitermination factor NusG